MKRIGQILKIGDIFVISFISISFVATFFIFRLLPNKGWFASIYVNGRQVYHLSLMEKKDVIVMGAQGRVRVRIEDGRIWVVESTCKQKICIRSGKISRIGEVIVCIPNRVMIRIDGKARLDVDGVTM